MSIRHRAVKVNDAAKRVIKYRKPSPSFVRDMNRTADNILEYCDQLWRSDAAIPDTAVRDVIADGIARLLYAAYDCKGCALGLNDEAFHGFISSSVGSWFRTRGFAEWYCEGAGTLFNNTRPRILSGGSHDRD